MQQNPSNGPRAALAIAHPGHEVRIFGWMDFVRPMVSILTDGSGLLGRPRLDSTIRLIESTGATTGDLIGLTTDRELYRRVVLQDKSFFLRISDQLAADWIRHEVEIVVGDAREGAIMAHDLWRRVIDRAVDLVKSTTGRGLRNLCCCLETAPTEVPFPGVAMAHQKELEPSALRRKICVVENYAGLENEVKRAFAAWGPSAFRHEMMFEMNSFPEFESRDDPARVTEHIRGAADLDRVVGALIGMYREIIAEETADKYLLYNEFADASRLLEWCDRSQSLWQSEFEKGAPSIESPHSSNPPEALLFTNQVAETNRAA